MEDQERRFLIALAEMVLRQDVMLTAISKMFFLRFQTLEDSRRMRAQLEMLPDSPEKFEKLEKLSALERSVDYSAETRVLTDLLSRQESFHEKLEASLNALKASLPPDSL